MRTLNTSTLSCVDRKTEWKRTRMVEEGEWLNEVFVRVLIQTSEYPVVVHLIYDFKTNFGY